jgi:predicted nucleic acid-binding protein
MFYLALLNDRDALHTSAHHWALQNRAPVVTTEFVLLEVANFFKLPKNRGKFATFISAIEADPGTTIIPCESLWFRSGLELFTLRLDKEWSLTDCISFVVMESRGLTDALTADHHFAQAGYNVLL